MRVDPGMSFQNNPCADPERGTGGIRLENHKAVGFFCNTGMEPRWSTGDLHPHPRKSLIMAHFVYYYVLLLLWLEKNGMDPSTFRSVK